MENLETPNNVIFQDLQFTKHDLNPARDDVKNFSMSV